MIGQIRGALVSAAGSTATVDLGGLGLEVQITEQTASLLGPPGTEVTLYTHLAVREDALTLFGFIRPEERQLFRDLISVSGIGPRLALGILSRDSVDRIHEMIARGDQTALKRLPGLGSKTAQRLILDLGGRISARLGERAPAVVRSGAALPASADEAILAMISLGYTQGEAEKAIAGVASETRDRELSTEELVKLALNAKA